ncbi:MAG TPA: hypothetical protein VGV37_13560 [Aliidongia sp.]|uniref:hypothetical protein n=1 Tax=Aliidongia sp. TaxID=1914230 RepID=UPI002DDCB11E|nr:hypothetical protein [Aliidongia sp.]HEV2675565.1 hypothetical protein [Aliidongia sp.]
MYRTKLLTACTALALSVGLVGSASAQTVGSEQQRDVDQQQRIDQGLKSGQLSTGEAARLEQGEAHVDRMESNADRNGNLSAAEKARIQNAQNRESAAIHGDKTNAVTGNPNSKSSQRMQADVGRDVRQDQRTEQGIKSGQVTNREAGRIDRGQAHLDHAEAAAGANGHVGAAEQSHVQHVANRQSGKIYRQKHNGRTRG